MQKAILVHICVLFVLTGPCVICATELLIDILARRAETEADSRSGLFFVRGVSKERLPTLNSSGFETLKHLRAKAYKNMKPPYLLFLSLLRNN